MSDSRQQVSREAVMWAVDAMNQSRDVFASLARRFEVEDQREGRHARARTIAELRAFSAAMATASRRLREEAER